MQGGSSSSQKSRFAAIFGSPVKLPSKEILRGAYQKTHAFPIMPSPFLRGKGDRLRWMRVDLTLLLSLPITRTVSPHLVAGKAPWQTARCACRLARCACRSSSQKVLRYFLGALFARARSLRGKPCIVDPCSEQLTVLYKIPLARSLAALAPSIGMTERKGNRVDASRMRRTNGYTQSNVCSRFPDGLPFAIFNASKILHSTFYIYHS